MEFTDDTLEGEPWRIGPCAGLPLALYGTTLDGIFKKMCHFQKHTNLTHQAVEDFHTISNLWPFTLWSLDIIGLLPKNTASLWHILVPTDYFIKWM